jgi:hypothetical protein
MEKRPLRISRNRWDDNIKVGVGEIDSSDSAQGIMA